MENTSAVENPSALTGVASGAAILNSGVFGQTSSTNGTGVQGLSLGLGGFPVGVGGQAQGTNGTGVFGLASATSGVPVGVWGQAYSAAGIGMYGLASATSGVPVGVYGETFSSRGYGLYTPDRLFVGDVAFFEGNLSMVTPARIFADLGSSNLPSISFNSTPDVGFFTPATNVLAIAGLGVERLRIDANGNLGLGRVPATNLLEVAGEASKATAGGWFANSDARIKTEVRALTNALQTIERVRPVSFRYSQAYRETHSCIEDKQYYNVIAQEFAKVFPEAVKESGETWDGKPILQVDTHPAVMCSIAAIHELHQLVKAKDAEMEKLKQQNAALEGRLARLEKLVTSLAENQPGGEH